MRDYGKVFCQIWESEDFRSLSEDGRTLVLYLLTCKHCTIAGVFRLADGYACEDLQWSPERVAEGFANLYAKGFATRCERTKWVWVIKFLEWNQPENPNQRKAVAKVASSVPDQCGWKPDFMRVCGPSLGIEAPPPAQPPQNPSGTVQQGLLNQYQEQKQEQKQEQDVGAAENGSPPAPPEPPPPPPPAAGASATRGTRLPKDWKLPKAWGDWALDEFPRWDADKVRLEADKFRDHWTAKGTKDAAKLDWLATWRNWCRDDLAHRGGNRPGQPVNRQAAIEAENNRVADEWARQGEPNAV